MTYDVGVGGDDHEGVEGEDGDGAQGEGTAGNLRRRHHCSWNRTIQFQPGKLKKIIRMGKIELLEEVPTCARPEQRLRPAGAAGAGTRERRRELGQQGARPRARGRRAELGAWRARRTRLRPRTQRQHQWEAADLRQGRGRANQPAAQHERKSVHG